MRRSAAVLLVALCAPGARAFVPEGHEVIEAAAYRDLVARPAVAGASGKEVVAFLIRHGVLAEPPCFDAKPGDRCREGAPIDVWPVLGTGSPDLLESRQFSTRGQCYHFMADAPDWRDSPPVAGGVTAGMARVAYQRCLRLMTSLYDEVLRDPYAALVRGRGTYVLMHAIVDSFSRAHTERGPDGAIRYLRVWIVRNWLTYLFDARRLDRRIHHAVVDDRDRDYIVRDQRCQDVVAAYEMPLDCLSPEGAAAEEALADFLVVTYRALHRVDGAGGEKDTHGTGLPIGLDREAKPAPSNAVSLDDRAAAADWRAFLERRFRSEAAPLVVEKQSDSEREWQPNLMLAARVRPDLGGQGWDAGITAGAVQVVRRALPLIPLETLTLGYGRAQGVGRLFLRADLSFVMPIWDQIGFGTTPIETGVDCVDDFSSCRGELATVPFRVSAFFHDDLWVDVAGPEFTWVDRVWVDRIVLTVGIAFDTLSRLKVGSPARAKEARAPWDPPPLDGGLIRKPPFTSAVFVEGHLLSGESDHLLSAGLELRKERDRHARRAGLGYGVELAYQRGSLASRRLDDGRLGIFLSYYLFPDWLSVRLSPASLALGSWGGDFYADCDAHVELTLSVNALDISLGSPRVSYVHRGENGATPLYLRFTWRLVD